MHTKLRYLRESKGLTQEKLGMIIGISQAGYSKYETGENDIPTSILIKLATFYHTSTDYLLGVTEEKTPYPYSQEVLGKKK